MKKRLISLILLGVMSTSVLTGCGVKVNEDSIVSKYDVDMKSDYMISETSTLGFKLVDLDESETGKDEVYMLCYLGDEGLVVDAEHDMVKSLNVGEYCISITSAVMKIDRTLNRNIVLDLLNRLSSEINNEDVIESWENLESPSPYIVTKNDKYMFIDYITTIPNSYNRVMYYRIIIQNIDTLGTEMTEEERKSLPNYLPELLGVLGVGNYSEIIK